MHIASSGSHHRNNSGNNLENRNHRSSNQHHQHHNDDDQHLESISFTNSNLTNNKNRYSNVDYSNAVLQEREYSEQSNQQRQISVQQQQQISAQQPPSQQRFAVSNESGANQMANQSNSQSTHLTTNHSLPISSSVIGKFVMLRFKNEIIIKYINCSIEWSTTTAIA